MKYYRWLKYKELPAAKKKSKHVLFLFLGSLFSVCANYILLAEHDAETQTGKLLPVTYPVFPTIVRTVDFSNQLLSVSECRSYQVGS